MKRTRNLLFGLGLSVALTMGVASAFAEPVLETSRYICPFYALEEFCADCCANAGWPAYNYNPDTGECRCTRS